MIVYKITNKINGKCYIGQTRQKLSVRWRQHTYKTSNSVGLKGAISKYGKHNFTMETLFQTDCQLQLNIKEAELIGELNTMVPNGYNLTTGGEGGYIRSEETKRKLSIANIGKRNPHTMESKAKLSKAHMGALNPMFGKKMSDEHKAKISMSLLGRRRSQEVKDKISAGHKRRQATPEPLPQSPLVPNAA